MTQSRLRGVIAAAATPITDDLQPDLPRFIGLCRWLLENGCDGLNICGTTGEATSFSVAQRMAIMRAAAAELPLARLMVGTGAASVGDAVALTKEAAALGFAGALVLPPFYYKGASDDGIVGYFERIAAATSATDLDLFLYNFPALSGVEFSPRLVERLVATFGTRIAGLKDSSGNLDYSAEIAALPERLAVFPSNEATLLKAREGAFAGCISASVNVNAELCAKAFRDGDEAALAKASAIRALVSRGPLIASVKAVLAHRLRDQAFEAVLPPLIPLAEEEKRRLLAGVSGVLG